MNGLLDRAYQHTHTYFKTEILQQQKMYWNKLIVAHLQNTKYKITKILQT